MTTRTPAPAPLKIGDLMERWGVSEDTVKEHIRKNGLPFWDAGTGRGRRPDYRFRLADVEAWEAARVRTRAKEQGASAAPAPADVSGLWDGKRRLSSRTRSKQTGL